MENECPNCSEIFSSESGMKTHHKLVHGESISGFEYKCEFCGDVTIREQRQGDQNVFCSKKCLSEYRSKEWNGKNHPTFEGSVKKCRFCGEEIIVSEYEKEKKTYCSRECQGKDYKDRFKKDGAPAWKDGMMILCPVCNDTFRIAPWERGERTTCSMECYSEYRSDKYSGSDHPQWKDGGKDIPFGPNYYENRKIVIKRDDSRCQICGKEFDDVHHIKPRRVFYNEGNGEYGDVDWDSCNSTENMVCLCKTHHERLEGSYTQCDNVEFILNVRSGSIK